MQLRAQEPLSRSQRAHVKAHCGHLFGRREPRALDPKWPWRYQIKQPRTEAFEVFADSRHFINAVELACDLAFPTWWHAEAMREYIHAHALKRWDVKRHGVRVVEGDTRYDAPREAGKVFVVYAEQHCRTTGELNGLHLEDRINGKRTCRRMGISSAKDLVGFDHTAHWQRRLANMFFTIDADKLGRIIRNKRIGTRRNKANHREWAKGYRVNMDRKLGNLVIRATSVHGPAVVQDVVKAYGLKLVRNSLRNIAVEWSDCSMNAG